MFGIYHFIRSGTWITYFHRNNAPGEQFRIRANDYGGVELRLKTPDIAGGRLLYRIPEAAERLGISRSTLYELIGAGEIQSVKIGAAVRIPAIELERFVERRLAQAPSEVR